MVLYLEINPARLSEKAKEILLNPKTEVFISAISVAEIACGYEKRFRLKEHWRPWLRKIIETNGWNIIPVEFEIMEEAYSLPEPFHRDPADRIIVATSRIRQIPVMTNDGLISEYPYVTVCW